MRFLIDENVPTSVSELLAKRGHEVILSREVLAEGVSDDIVAAYASANELIVVTWNAKDFIRLIGRRPTDNHNKRRNAGLLCLTCNETRGAQRLEEVIDLIEYEHKRAGSRKDRRVIIDVGQDFVRIVR